MWNSVTPMDTLRDGMLGVRIMFTERNASLERRQAVRPAQWPRRRVQGTG
jgi:hypothetical protein